MSFLSKSILFLRRASTVAVEDVRAQPAATVMRKVVVETSKSNVLNEGKVGNEEVGKEVFWMRDPKTGNWIPETHFNQVDAAELRAKLLAKAPKS